MSNTRKLTTLSLSLSLSLSLLILIFSICALVLPAQAQISSNLDGVTWNSDFTECTISQVVDGQSLRSEMSNHKATVAKVIFRDGAGITGSAEHLFYDLNGLTSINGAFTTDGVINMQGMFSVCTALTSVDFSLFNTRDVESMAGMFLRCYGLATLDLSSFDTSNVNNMKQMFQSCILLESLNLSSFHTSNVTDMAHMFDGCEKLTQLNVSNFVTTNVTTMQSMFSGCDALPTLILSNFNTSNVTNMNAMFSNCYALATLDLSNFVVDQVTNLSGMFALCSQLKTVNLSGFVTKQTTNLTTLFAGCSALSSIVLGKGFTFQTGTYLPGLSNSTNPFWISSINNAVSYNTSEADSVANINAVLQDLPEGGTQTFTRASVVLSFNANGGTYQTETTNADEISYLYGNAAETGVSSNLPEPTRTNYKFKGWSSVADGAVVTVPDAFPATDTTYYAAWAAVYENTFNANGHGYFGSDTTKVTTKVASAVGEKLQGPDDLQENEGWTFTGWYTQASGGTQVVPGTTDAPTTATTYYAHWQGKSIANTFNANDHGYFGSDTSATTVQITSTVGEKLQGPTNLNAEDGWTFDGWYTEASGGTQVVPGTTDAPTTATTYYAHWKGITVTNTFNANGHGTFSGADALSVASTYGDGLTLPETGALTPERGYVFDGWYTAATGGTQVDANTDCPLRATTYYAHYRDAARVALTFDAGEGTVDGKSQLVLSDLLEGDKVDSVSNAEREGYTFTGWKNAATGKIITFPLTVPGVNTTYVAQYEKIPAPTPDPEPSPSNTGWSQDETGWQYTDSDGNLTHGWLNLDGTWYYFDDAGYAVHDMWLWNEDFGPHWYYFWGDCAMAWNAWLWDDTQASWYWVCSTGPMIQGLWQWIDNAWYGFWWNGQMCTGWVWDNSYVAWFYCYNNGVVARNTWVDGYYLSDSGICLL